MALFSAKEVNKTVPLQLTQSQASHEVLHTAPTVMLPMSLPSCQNLEPQVLLPTVHSNPPLVPQSPLSPFMTTKSLSNIQSRVVTPSQALLPPSLAAAGPSFDCNTSKPPPKKKTKASYAKPIQTEDSGIQSVSSQMQANLTQSKHKKAKNVAAVIASLATSTNLSAGVSDGPREPTIERSTSTPTSHAILHPGVNTNAFASASDTSLPITSSQFQALKANYTQPLQNKSTLGPGPKTIPQPPLPPTKNIDLLTSSFSLGRGAHPIASTSTIDHFMQPINLISQNYIQQPEQQQGPTTKIASAIHREQIKVNGL